MSTPASTPQQAPPPAPTLPARPAAPSVTWPAILVEGESDKTQDVALALAADERVGELFWIDWASGLADQWVNGTRVNILDRPSPTSNWDRQLQMLDKIAEYGRHHLATTGKPIAVIVDSMSDLYSEHRRWARYEANNVPKIRAALRQYPGLAVPIDSNLWDEIESRQSDFLRAVNAIPGISMLLAAGSLRVTDGDGAALAVPEYRVDAHRIIQRRVHVDLRVDHIGLAYPVKVPPLWRDKVDPAAPLTISELVFDVFGLDPKATVHHIGN